MSPEWLLPRGRRTGAALLATGIAVLAALALTPAGLRGETGEWILRSGLTPERLLALAGLGAAIALSGGVLRIAGLAGWALGLLCGYHFWVQMIDRLQGLPGAVTHNFLTLPVSFLAAGLALIGGPRLRPVLLPPAALLVGAMHALSVRLSDPGTGGGTAIALAGAAFGVWVLAVPVLLIGTWRRPWLGIAGRILGSWLIAIGLLYGGSATLPGKRRLPPAAPAPASAAAIPGAGAFPDFGAPPDGAVKP